MLTLLTRIAIAVLHDLSNGGIPDRLTREDTSKVNLSDIFLKLEVKRIIRLKPGHERGTLCAYNLGKLVHQISLFDIVDAVGENIAARSDIMESIIGLYGNLDGNPNVMKRITCEYLESIKLADL